MKERANARDIGVRATEPSQRLFVEGSAIHVCRGSGEELAPEREEIPVRADGAFGPERDRRATIVSRLPSGCVCVREGLTIEREKAERQFLRENVLVTFAIDDTKVAEGAVRERIGAAFPDPVEPRRVRRSFRFE